MRFHGFPFVFTHFYYNTEKGNVQLNRIRENGTPARIRTQIGGFGDRSPTIERQMY